MNPERLVMGLFKDDAKAAAAVTTLEKSPYTVKTVFSPIPSRRLAEALKVKKSKVGYFTLAGGIIGFFLGFALAVFCATRWDLIVGGKPVVALVPFFIVGFEFTILFAVLGNVLGFFLQTRLPRYQDLDLYDPRCSGEHYGVLAACNEGQQADLEALLIKQEGRIKTFT